MSRLLVMAGGTGGHVFPALAVARWLAARGVDVVWLGTRNGLEARVVPEAGFEIEWISARALRGVSRLRWATLPFELLRAVWQALAVIRRRRPDALLGMGGFASGPGGLAGWLSRRPLVIHEANAIPGLTNRALARVAKRVLTGFPAPLAGARGGEWVGNPVGAAFAALPSPEERLRGRTGRLRLLVVGGSQGARVLNETVAPALARVDAAERPDVRHQCGRGNEDSVTRIYRQEGVEAEVEGFIADMADAYGWADVVVCRAGAMTVAEVCAAGVPAIFVPYPFAVSDHQRANASFVVDHEGAWLLPQAEFDAERLAAVLARLDRQTLLERALRARSLARLDATDRAGQACLEVLHA